MDLNPQTFDFRISNPEERKNRRIEKAGDFPGFLFVSIRRYASLKAAFT